MKPTILLLIFISCFKLNVLGVTPNYKKAENGTINLKDWNFNNQPIIKLNGMWEFYPNQFLYTSNDTFYLNKSLIKVPLAWNKSEDQNGLNNGIGFGTYKLVIDKNNSDQLYLSVSEIHSACKIWVNNTLKYQAGIISKQAEDYIPQTKPQYIETIDNTERLEIVIEVANYSLNWGGIVNNIKIGRKDQIILSHDRHLISFFFLFGAIFMIGIYHIGMFILKRTDIPSLNFGVFCFFIDIAFLLRSKTFYYYYSNFNWELGQKIEHIALFFTLPLFYTFFYLSFKKDFFKFFKVLAIIISSILSFITLVTPAIYFTKLTTTFHVVLLVYALAVTYSLSKTIYQNRRGGKIILTGFVLFFIALTNDILHVQNVINTGNYILYGVFGFVVMQALFLSQKSAFATKKIEQLSDKLLLTNQSLKRFVPSEFLQILNKEDITEVNLGDNVEQNMTIMFSDIRSFTKISEKLDAKSSFNFINSYLKNMGPIIRKNNGFIDKYIGDGIMALFNQSADDAVKCSIEMIGELNEFNKANMHSNLPLIKIGIGLHTGNCMLGTVGEFERLDTTVISDAVNVSSRIESLTKIYSTPVLISESTYLQLSNKEEYKIRYIGNAKVKGKSDIIKLFEIVLDNAYSVAELAIFNDAIESFYNKEYSESFIKLNLLTNKTDKIYNYYFNKLKNIETNNFTEDLSSIEIFNY